MIARCNGLTPCDRAQWEVELHLGTDACCFQITSAAGDINPPSIQSGWISAQLLARHPKSDFPKAFQQ